MYSAWAQNIYMGSSIIWQLSRSKPSDNEINLPPERQIESRRIRCIILFILEEFSCNLLICLGFAALVVPCLALHILTLKYTSISHLARQIELFGVVSKRYVVLATVDRTKLIYRIWYLKFTYSFIRHALLIIAILYAYANLFVFMLRIVFVQWFKSFVQLDA